MAKKRLLSQGLVIAGLVGCSQHPAHPTATEQRYIPAGEIGSRMPDFSTTDLQGHSLNAADLRGKVVIIDFWATWCAPCKKEMPGYQMLMDRYGTQGLAAVGFKFDMMKDTEDPVSFASRIGVRYPLAVATKEVRERFGGIEGLPTTMLYDRAGILRKKVVGFEYTSVFETQLKPLL